MKPGRHTRARWTPTIILLLLILTSVIIDIGLRVFAAAPEPCDDRVTVPREFVYRYPDCAQKLIETANIDNVQIVPPENHRWDGGYTREDTR